MKLVEEITKNDRLNALAAYLNVDANEYFDMDNYFNDNVFKSKQFDEEYLVLTEKEAYDRAVEEIKSVYDDLGLESFTPQFQDWIVNNAVQEDFFDNILDEEIEYFTNEEPDEDRVKALESYRNNPHQYIIDYFGLEELSRLVKENNAVDLDMVAKEAIAQDGVSHFIALYDGDELDLGNGLYGYRIN